MNSYVSHKTLPWEGHLELKLPDGTPVNDLRREPLYKELCRLGVPEIDTHMGKNVLLEKYQAFVDARTQYDKQRFMKEMQTSLPDG